MLSGGMRLRFRRRRLVCGKEMGTPRLVQIHSSGTTPFGPVQETTLRVKSLQDSCRSVLFLPGLNFRISILMHINAFS
jgi:hypothetical protein